MSGVAVERVGAHEVVVGDVRAGLERLAAEVESGSRPGFQEVVTSPPYWGLRDYGTAAWEGGDPSCAHAPVRGIQGASGERASRTFTGAKPQGQRCSRCGARRIDAQIGLEATPDEYVAALVEVFRGVRRVLREDGVVWLNLGDCYGGSGCGGASEDTSTLGGGLKNQNASKRGSRRSSVSHLNGLKSKDLVGVPFRVESALRDDGWFVRARLPWVKRSAMPDSTRDRPGTAGVEWVLMLTVSGRTRFRVSRFGNPHATRRVSARGREGLWEHARTGERTAVAPPPRLRRLWRWVPRWVSHDYLYDDVAVRRVATSVGGACFGKQSGDAAGARAQSRACEVSERNVAPGRRGFRCSDLFYDTFPRAMGLVVDAEGHPAALDVNPRGFAEAHFATFPPELVEPLVLASTSEGGCCVSCGAPRVRISERSTRHESGSGRSGRAPAGKHAGSEQAVSGGYDVRMGPVVSDRTVGWRASCECGAASAPCAVLDPFCGSGTVGAVCERLGRRFVGIELNPEYAGMAMRRIGAARDRAGLFSVGVQHESEVIG